MTLIAAVHLPRKLYLAGDTRVTYKDVNSGAILRTENNLLKVAGLAPRVRMMVAGDARLAAHFSFELRKLVNRKTTINQFRQIVERHVGSIVDSYLQRGGKRSEGVAIIFAGHNKSKGKFINSAWASEILDKSRPPGEGTNFYLPIDVEIMRAIGDYAKYHGDVKDGTMVWASNLPSSRVFALKIKRIDGSVEPEFIECPCHGSLVIHPKEGVLEVAMPAQYLHNIDYPASEGFHADMEKDCGLLQTFVLTAAEQHKLDTVGGCVFGMRVVPDGDYYLTGELRRKRRQTGQDEQIFRIFMEDGALAYEVGEEKGFLRSFENYLNEGGIEARADMEL